MSTLHQDDMRRALARADRQAAKPKHGGHPARQDEDVAKLFRAMRTTVELVQTLDGKLTPDRMLELKAAALGLMGAYSELANLPSPTELLERT